MNQATEPKPSKYTTDSTHKTGVKRIKSDRERLSTVKGDCEHQGLKLIFKSEKRWGRFKVYGQLVPAGRCKVHKRGPPMI